MTLIRETSRFVPYLFAFDNSQLEIFKLIEVAIEMIENAFSSWSFDSTLFLPFFVIDVMTERWKECQANKNAVSSDSLATVFTSKFSTWINQI